ncbi:type II-A CRISPR-associated protein Csn2 [Fusobacterium pseudoperiodonticum]|jgi:CRISPR-associated protein, csn2 family|uniref:Type II-A CRISPR-associated protein Csn2 n=1 Tax=Fusobacterium pseudoperiodonticum TaxID=2663009 RepID=A0A2D3PS19_9FUSO|nr:type II-A CRISPR-associated protein Csn2 [Fusobacterium pseudoperiodonticum]ATV70451.1 type II-A CRISPR-associated protein Csn2 [Fusobacterium pseudoperiodonticum]
MIFQYQGFNFKIDFENKSIFSLIIENKKLYRKIIEDLINNISIDDGNIILSKNNKLIVPEKEIFVFSDYFNFDVNKFVLNKYYKELKNLSENDFFDETLEIKEVLRNYVTKLVENEYSIKLEEDLDISQILKAFGIKFQRNKDLLLNLFEWIKILNELLGYEIFFFINLENFLSNDELVEFSKFILYNKYRVVFLENFNRNKLFDDDNLIIIDNDLCEIF